MSQFAIPAVGTKITVTTRYKEIYLFATSPWRDTVYSGTVLPNCKWTRPNAFNLSGDAFIPVREIAMDTVHDLKMDDGSEGEKVAVGDETQTLTVPGSKPGVTYTVLKTGNKITCTCPGFTFKKSCKHVELIK